MNLKSSLSIILLMFPVLCHTQSIDSRILLTVDGKKIEAGEFIRMYNKSIEPGKKSDVDEYLKQFIVFKLKVADAIRLGYDTTRAFRTELKGYRNQLAQSYLTDNQTKEKLMRSAYQRSLTEVNAWHILISLPPDPTSDDTLKAWQKATDIRERILTGESFELVARSASDDQSVKVNGGNLGYFSVFQMIMPFEDAAYSLRKGEVSRPVRTAYGYHIIKVTDKRPSRGRIKVAHIMKACPPGADEKKAEEAEKAISDVYKKLREGTPFSILAAKYSDHAESAGKRGELEWFGTGENISDFSEAAFALRDTGTYTKPVRTLYGWHIIKLIARQAPRSYEESKSFLESRINQSYLNSISKKSFISKLRKDYKFRINQPSYNWFVKNTDTLIIQGLKKYARDSMPSGVLYSFATIETSNREFADYIEKRGFKIVTDDSVKFIDATIETKSSDQLFNYENSILDKKYPEFRYLLNEFNDGILLFEISGKKVWNKVNSDTAGLMNYYQLHKNEHLTQPGTSGIIYTLKSSGKVKAFHTAYRKYSSKKNTSGLMMKKFNKRNDSILFIDEHTWYRGDDSAIDSLGMKKGSLFVERNGFPCIFEINGMTEPVPLEFGEVQAEMMTGYQDYLENTWIEQLNRNYAVKIDNLVLGEVKKKLEHE